MKPDQGVNGRIVRRDLESFGHARNVGSFRYDASGVCAIIPYRRDIGQRRSHAVRRGCFADWAHRPFRGDVTPARLSAQDQVK
jgi:hypothetical protein